MVNKDFSFEVLSQNKKARVGKINTPRGFIDTPAFMPVGTLGTVKGIFTDDILKTGTQIILDMCVKAGVKNFIFSSSSSVYGERERREGEQLNRVQAQITGAQQQQVAERASKAGYISSGIGAVGDIAGSLSGLGGGGGKTGPYGISSQASTSSAGVPYLGPSNDFSRFANYTPMDITPTKLTF